MEVNDWNIINNTRYDFNLYVTINDISLVKLLDNQKFSIIGTLYLDRQEVHSCIHDLKLSANFDLKILTLSSIIK